MCALQCSHHICGNKRECTFQVRSGIRAALCFWRFVLEGRLFVCHPCVCMFLPTAARLRQRLSTYDLQPGPLECPQLPTRTMAYDTRQQHVLSVSECRTDAYTSPVVDFAENPYVAPCSIIPWSCWVICTHGTPILVWSCAAIADTTHPKYN